MIHVDEYISRDATALADLVRRKEVTPLELVEAAITLTERLNPALNAVVTPMFDQARKAAVGDLPSGPFTGLPFLLKDLGASCAGVRQTMGSAYLKNYIPLRNSELVNRLNRAGLIIMGKTNLPEFGILPTTEPALFGPCRNPWDLSRSTGGSSGGSAAAVAAGIVPIAHGNDGAGSIRIPASCCGVFGFKPTRARNPLGPDLGDMISGLVVEHAVSRSVRDSAALLDATSGPDIGDPYWAPPSARPFREEVVSPPGKLRIAFSTQGATQAQVHADCIRAVQDVAKLCASLGHEVAEATPVLNGEWIAQAFLVLYAAGCAWSIDAVTFLTGQVPNAEFFEPFTWAFYQQGRQHNASSYLLSLSMLQMISREVARFFLTYDVWLTPTVSEPPVPLGTFRYLPENPLSILIRAATFAPFTPICNITGQPAMSLPLFWNEAGLPIGVHFIGRFGDEATLFRLAGQLEAARPWAARRPPLTTRQETNGT